MLKAPFLQPLPWKGIIPINLSRIKELSRRIKSGLGAKYAVFETAVHRIQREVLESAKGGFGGSVLKSFREYGAFSLVVSSALLVSVTNVTQEQGSESPVFGYFRDTVAEASEMPRKQFASTQSAKTSLSLAPLATGTSAVDPSEKDTAEEVGGVSFQSGVLLSAQTDASIAKDPEEEGGVSIYTVASGDTVSGIAAKHGITVNTILWANDLDNVDSIRPGDQIFILPVAGLSHKVASGETIDAIASKYKAERDKIIAFNNLPANGELKAGETIIIPEGYKEVPQAAPDQGLARRQYASSSGAGSVLDISSGFKKLEGKAGTGHRFPYGYCTWYVAQKRYVPWGGNAGTWLYHARAMGYKTGKTPTKGSIVVTTDNAYYGHVALVEKVSGGTITVSEMNYRGWGKVNTRVIATNSRSIKGYIY